MHALRCNDATTAGTVGTAAGGTLASGGTNTGGGIAGGGGTTLGGTSILQLSTQPQVQPQPQQQPASTQSQTSQLPKGGPVRINGIKGYQNRTNHIIYCPPLLRSKDDCSAVVYFGGDVQVRWVYDPPGCRYSLISILIHSRTSRKRWKPTETIKTTSNGTWRTRPCF